MNAEKLLSSFIEAKKAADALKDNVISYLKEDLKDCDILVTNIIDLADYNKPGINITIKHLKKSRSVKIKCYFSGKMILQGFRGLTLKEKKKYNFPWGNEFKTCFWGTVNFENETVFQAFYHGIKDYFSSKHEADLKEKPEPES